MIFLQVLLIIAMTMGISAGGRQQQEISVDDFPPFVGLAIRFVTPTSGQKIAAGDSLSVVIEVDSDLQLETVMVVFPGGGLFLEPPFSGQIPIARDRIGVMTLSAIGKTATGGMVSSKSITVEVEVRDAELVTVAPFDERPRLSGPGDVSSIYVYGEYSDGIRREITNYHTSYTIVEGTDIACVTDDGAIVGRSPGDASVIVRHGIFEEILHVNVGNQTRRNNTPQAFLQDIYEGAVGEILCFSANGSRDYDACLGEHLGEESFQWKLEFESARFEGVGSEFCITPEEARIGLLKLVVTDIHGASSWTMAMVVIN